MEFCRAEITLSRQGIIHSAELLACAFLGFDQPTSLINLNIFDFAVSPEDIANLTRGLTNADNLAFDCTFLTQNRQSIMLQCQVQTYSEDLLRLCLNFIPRSEPKTVSGSGEPAESRDQEERQAQQRVKTLEEANRRLQEEIGWQRKAEKELRKTEELFQLIYDGLPDPAVVWRKDPNGEIRIHMANQAAVEFSKGRMMDYIGLELDDFFSNSPQIASMIRETFNDGQTRRIETFNQLRSTGEEKWLLADYARLSEHYLLNIVRDITDQKSQQQAQETARSQIELLRQAITAFTSVLNLEQVLEQVLDYLKLLIPFDRALLYVLSKDQLEVVAAAGFPDNLAHIGRTIPARNPQFEAINRNRFPLYLHNAEEYRPFQELEDLNCGKGWLGVPFFSHGQVTGYLSIYNNAAGIYGGDEANLAQTFASEASIAIENARLFQQVQQIAITDSLTGFYNRRYFYELAEIELRRTQRYNSSLSLVMIDIDYFKRVNDQYGHAAGDQVLVHLCECLRREVRESDIIGRFGGEEFVILLPETGLKNAAEVAERLRKTAETCSTPLDESEVSVTISLGVASLDESCEDIDALFRRADQALYAAKQGGRNQISTWQETTTE